MWVSRGHRRPCVPARLQGPRTGWLDLRADALENHPMSALVRRRRLWALLLLVGPIVLVVWTMLGARRAAEGAREKLEAALAREGLSADLPDAVHWSWRGVVSAGPVRVS